MCDATVLRAPTGAPAFSRGAVGVRTTIGESATQSAMEYGCSAYQGWRRQACSATRRRVSASVISCAVTARSRAGSRR